MNMRPGWVVPDALALRSCMKCQDAINSLRAAQDEFGLRYYRCRHGTALEYCVPVGRWYLQTQVELGGRSQLACSQHVEARRARDLCRCTLSGGHGINLLGWCGVHPSTHTSLIETSQLDAIATLLREVFAYVLQEAPAWLSGLDHAVPETIDDANTWLKARLAAGLQRKQ